MPRKYRNKYKWRFSRKKQYGVLKDRAQYSPSKPVKPSPPSKPDQPVQPRKPDKAPDLRYRRRKPRGWKWYNPRFFDAPSGRGGGRISMRNTARTFVTTYAYLRWLELLKL